MNLLFVGIICLFFLIYGTGHFYIGSRLLQCFSNIYQPRLGIYWAGFAVLALSPFMARMIKRGNGGALIEYVALLGDYWLAFFYYSVLLWALIDISRFATKGALALSQNLGLGVVLVVVALLAYGTWNARSPRITRHEVTINKKVEGLAELRAVLVSDIHLGTTINNKRLADMVDRINQLNPDIVFFAGDIIDGDVSEFAEKQMPEIFSKLHPPFGCYAIFGNHEYISGNSQDAVKYLSAAGIKVLRDTYVKVNDMFYIVGRDDRSGNRMRNAQRKDLSTVMSGIDHSLPIILLDHQPSNLAEPLASGVDLQLSGHTHRGQFFPNNFVTDRIYEVDWGYLRKESLQVIVSCGYGTWGPPIRIGSYSEIVDLHITFKGN